MGKSAKNKQNQLSEKMFASTEKQLERYNDEQIVQRELLGNCSRRIGDPEIVLHKSIHPIYSDDKYWKERGWCSVKCCSLNWPHACNFMECCNADPEYCFCIL